MRLLDSRDRISIGTGEFAIFWFDTKDQSAPAIGVFVRPCGRIGAGSCTITPLSTNQ
jgi:hypothetical protein